MVGEIIRVLTFCYPTRSSRPAGAAKLRETAEIIARALDRADHRADGVGQAQV
jgi:hypothetical protein